MTNYSYPSHGAGRHVIPPAELARVGRAIFGDQWQRPLARALKMNERSMRYLARGERLISPGIVADIVEVVEARGKGMATIAEELKAVLMRED